MTRSRKAQPREPEHREMTLEQAHGHCADVLMDDYGIPKNLRGKVLEHIDATWKQFTMIHDLIIASVRGFYPHPVTKPLEEFLDKHKTHTPKNRARRAGPL